MSTGMTPEGVYLRLRDEVIARERLQTRVDVLEHFIKEQYPGYFAGEAETVADPELKPIPIIFGAPQEGDPQQWKDRNNGEGR